VAATSKSIDYNVAMAFILNNNNNNNIPKAFYVMLLEFKEMHADAIFIWGLK